MHNLTDPRVQQKRPTLPDPSDEPRREHSRLRRRILEGWWRQDLDERIGQFFPAATVERLGYRDQTRNPFKSLVDQLAQLYSKPPTVEHAGLDESRLSDLEAKFRAAELWAVAGRNQRQVVGMRESLIRVAWAGDGLQFRVVPPDMVWASAHPDHPADPSVVVEARIRTLDRGGKKEARWTWDVLDIRDEPSFRVLLPDGPDPSKGQDITAQVLGAEFSGDAYPYMLNGTEPAMPYVLYHADGGGSALWDPYTGKEQIESTLTVSTLWTLWNYCVRDASSPIRGLVNGEIRGVSTSQGSNAGTRREVPHDPTTMVMIDQTGPGPVQAMQWAAGCDPERLQLAIDAYEQRALISSGISPADIQQSGAAQSGYAISLKRSFIRERQAAMVPQMEAGDRRVLALAASLCNAAEGTAYPESGYNLRYQQIDLSPDERAARVAEARSGIEMGTRSIVDVVIAENPGFTRDEALSWLERIQAEAVTLTEIAAAATAPAAGVPGIAADGGEKLADTALNGAQVAAAKGIVESVAVGALPRDAGISMLSEFFNLPRDAAERIMGSVGASFRPTIGAP